MSPPRDRRHSRHRAPVAADPPAADIEPTGDLDAYLAALAPGAGPDARS